ncbi:MAG: DNA repair protein RecO [Brachymonas sp.]|nr:DNA repair protein RecO [Brachymonas sp.]
MKRITHEPAYVLHSYDWSESSLILEVLTRHHGRTALVAKGAKRPSSGFRPVLLPLQPLHLNYAGDAEIRTLKSAEWMGGHVMPSGDALLAGYYINELMIRLLARDDPHPALFDAYAATVAWLATHAGQGENLQAVLRAFELVLLREAGLLPALDVQTLSYQPLQADAAYALTPESGLLVAPATQARTLSGQHWLALQAAMDDAAPLRALLSLCLAQREVALALKPQLRELLYYHCGVARLRTRQLLVDLHNL